jgi:hypothetical protein
VGASLCGGTGGDGAGAGGAMLPKKPNPTAMRGCISTDGVDSPSK